MGRGVPTFPGLEGGVPILARGYLQWQGCGTYLGRGYLPRVGTPCLGR